MEHAPVYRFGSGQADGSRRDRALLGGKGADLAEMTRLGIPVPPGFTITTEVCRVYLREGRYPDELDTVVEDQIRWLEGVTGKEFGGEHNPLLVSVRSGAAVSMPGMMDTVLNLGLNDATVAGLAAASGDERFAYDAYRRFVQMYARVVLGAPAEGFEALLDAKKERFGARTDAELDAEALRELVREFKALVEETSDREFPEDPRAQLHAAIAAVFESWRTPRAIAYRKVHGIPNDLGTAVSVVSMVFGNLGEDSGTGVAFTRDPATGEKRFYGEFLVNAQGEDVVAGTRDPLPIEEMVEVLPDAYAELLEIQERLERHYRDMLDLEFTIERGTLYMLQARSGKRTAAAALRIAVDMADEGLIDEAEAVRRIEPEQLSFVLHRQIDPQADPVVMATGLPASPGAAVGRIALDADRAVEMAEEGEPVVLVRPETSPDDFHGMVAAAAIVTARGGMTSHAAVVARGMGRCCVVGAQALRVDLERRNVRAGEIELREGDWITVDGSEGRILLGQIATVEPEPPEAFHRVMAWADRYRRLGVRTNADTPEDAAKAREFGAEGIGLCRTEHMFFEPDRIQTVRKMLLARDTATRDEAIEALLPVQRSDFEAIFRVMDGLPVTIRLIDPPLHEFLPTGESEIRALAASLGIEADELRAEIERHREVNPMLGHRGVRLGMSYPMVTEMQTRAIFEAAVAVARDGVPVRPEIMVPLVATVGELRDQAERVRLVAREVLGEAGLDLEYHVGTMIELPRAALTAGSIAREADFFSFGTNDLTQTVFGISRDDAGTYLPRYIEAGILEADPFYVLDREGVGRLVELATREGRNANAKLEVGVCGEHGGEASSVEFFHEIGLDYVSCSPYRVPVARLAAAQAVLKEREEISESEDDEGARQPVGLAAAD